jgi:hypothetical protein
MSSWSATLALVSHGDCADGIFCGVKFAISRLVHYLVTWAHHSCQYPARPSTEPTGTRVRVGGSVHFQR